MAVNYDVCDFTDFNISDFTDLHEDTSFPLGAMLQMSSLFIRCHGYDEVAHSI